MQRVSFVNSALRRLTALSKIFSVTTSSSRSYHRKLSTMSYSIVERGAPNTLDHRIYFNGPSGIISPFHDIPLFANDEKTILNMVVEIPRWTNHKMEISKDESLNPIKQDVKKGKLRFVKNIFPHHGYIWNYGALPQTWEDPNHEDPDTKTKGDLDPLDACEIGSKVHKRGAVIQVKVLGVMCLIDEGETDWKLICIDVTDPLAKDLNDIGDVDKVMPGFIRASNEWFRFYKVPDGKPENQFAFEGRARNKEKGMQVVMESFQFWKNLISGQNPNNSGINRDNTSVADSPFKISQDDAKNIVEKNPPQGPPASLPDDVDKWHYVSK